MKLKSFLRCITWPSYIHAPPAAAAVVLERTFYQVSEDVNVVEVCAIMKSPVIGCPIVFPIDIILRTVDNSAGNWKTEIAENNIVIQCMGVSPSMSCLACLPGCDSISQCS